MQKTHKAPEQAMRRFSENRYGMFIHFGMSAIYGRGEWAMCLERIPLAEYRKAAPRFRPRPGCMDEWVKLAQAAGMRYMCLITRHHDGYSLFDSPVNPFNTVRVGPRRDLVREFVEACRQGGLRPCLYYSVADWSDPGFIVGPRKDPRGWKRFVNIARTELKTLMSNYGEIDYLFYDGCPPIAKVWNGAEINAEIRRLQPNILISDRCGLDEDVASAEQHTMGNPGKPWECCMTTNDSWGYNWSDDFWKTPRQIVLTLLRCLHNGGNFLLNVGPKPDGSIPAPCARLLRQVGGWVARNAAAVYGTQPNPFAYADQKLSVFRDHTAYVPLHCYYGPGTVVAGIGNRVRSVRVLGTGQTVRFRQQGNRLLLTGLPRQAPDKPIVILAFELDGPPRGVPNPLMGNAKYE